LYGGSCPRNLCNLPQSADFQHCPSPVLCSPERIPMMSQSHLPDEALFKAFVDRPIVAQIARKQTRNTPILWEDAAQAAYAKLWQATRDGKFRHGNLEDYCHWAARVCCFAILDFLQHSHNRQHLSLDQWLPGTEVPLVDTLVDEFNAMDALERAERLLNILNIITDLDRQHSTTIYTTIWNSLLLGKKQKEIAQDLKMGTSDISRYVKKIRERVAQIYQSGDGDKPDRVRTRSDDNW
jgi:RNA polymerase sigma factor (sigma-70 family)